jgi:hypothetical protein
MTRRTRYFLFGSVAFLLVGLCTGLVAYYSGLPIGAFSRSDAPNELAYVPSDAALVAYCDVQQVMHSELRQKLHKTMPHREEGQAEFERQTGINLEQDIDHVVGFLVPSQAAERYSGMVLASGRFDVVKLEALAREHGGEVEQYNGKRLITRVADDNEHGGRSMTVAFMSPGVVGLGDTEHIKRAIDRVSSGTNILANKELMGLVDDIDDNNAWAVGRFDALMSHANLPQGVASQIPAIRWFSASGHVNGGVSGQLRAEARDEQAGQNLRDVVNGFLALARLQSGNKPEMQALVSSLQLSGNGKTVALSFAIPAEVIDALGAAGNALHGHDATGDDEHQEHGEQ